MESTSYIPSSTEIDSFKITISELTMRVQALESILAQALCLLPSVPDDMIAELDRLGIIVQVAEPTCSGDDISIPDTLSTVGSHRGDALPGEEGCGKVADNNVGVELNVGENKPVNSGTLSCKTKSSGLRTCNTAEESPSVEPDSITVTHVSRSGRKCKRLKLAPDKPRRKEKLSVEESKSQTAQSDDNSYGCCVSDCSIGGLTISGVIKHLLDTHYSAAPVPQLSIEDTQTSTRKPENTAEGHTENCENKEFSLSCCVKSCPVYCSNIHELIYHLKQEHVMEEESKRKIDNQGQHRGRMRTKVIQGSPCEDGKVITGSPCDGGKVKCPTCGKVLLSSGMARHMTKHERRVVCDLCGERCTTQGQLLNHKLRVHHHTHLAKYTCTQCGMGFSVQSSLKSHLEICNKYTCDVRCDVCSQTFVSKRYLQTHMKTVHGEKKYACHICDKSFGMKSSRDRHVMVVHEKKGAARICPICKIRLKDFSALSVHKRREHPDNLSYRCVICSAGFDKRISYRKHLTKAHNLDSVIGEDRTLKILGIGDISELNTDQDVHVQVQIMV